MQLPPKAEYRMLKLNAEWEKLVQPVRHVNAGCRMQVEQTPPFSSVPGADTNPFQPQIERKRGASP